MGGERKVNRGNHTIWGVWSHTFFCVVPRCKFRILSNSTFWPCAQRPVLQVIPLVTTPSGQRCLRPATSHVGFLATYHLLQLRLMLEGELEQRVVTLEPELLADVGAVVFDRTVMDE